MNKLSFNLKAVTPQDDTLYKARIEPGVHEVVIVDIVEGENDNGKDYIDLVMDNLTGTRTHTQRMFCTTPKGIEWTARRLKEIFVTIYGPGKEPENLVVSQLKTAFVGKKLRCMFLGREVPRFKQEGGKTVSDGTFWVADLRLSNFCEPLSIPATESRFVFDKTKHMKAIEPETATEVKHSAPQFLDPSVNSPESDLPFDTVGQVPAF
jgi:hypothetical protein